MKSVAILVIPFLCAAAASPEIEAVIEAARAAPGEFAADALIRIATGDALDRDRRIALLAQAFERAAEAQQPLKRVAALVRNVGPVGFVNKAYNQELDALSLRLRAVEGMLPLDAAKAREMFARIPELRIPKVPCDDFQVYEVDRFYDVLEKIAASADAAELVRLLERPAAAVTSPVQIAGMARVLRAADLKDAEFRALVESFAVVLGKVAGDDRSFTYSRNIGKHIEALTDESKRRKISPLPLLESYRVYLVFNLTGSRCTDGDLMQGGGLQAFAVQPAESGDLQAADFAGFFNARLRMDPLQLIGEVEATPSRLEGAATGLRTCQDPECVALTDLFRELFFGPDNQPVAPAQRSTPEWSRKLTATLDALNAWKQPSRATPAEFFREKAGAYSELLSLVPAGAGRERVVRAYVAFLTANPFQKTNRMEWFLPVNALIARMGLDSAGFGAFAVELRKSHDPVIAMYTALEALAPRAPDRVLLLL